jgi:hypothetical protein
VADGVRIVSAVIAPLRRSLRSKLAARLRCLRLRWLISHAERDLAHHQEEFERASKHLPRQIALDRDHINRLTIELMQALRNT